jgi:hypothetical protein
MSLIFHVATPLLFSRLDTARVGGQARSQSVRQAGRQPDSRVHLVQQPQCLVANPSSNQSIFKGSCHPDTEKLQEESESHGPWKLYLHCCPSSTVHYNRHEQTHRVL